jgi:hypothetical protein
MAITVTIPTQKKQRFFIPFSSLMFLSIIRFSQIHRHGTAGADFKTAPR